ncbi:hypothetical protein ABF176_002384 [Flavobacterium psychrophilum]|uniref:hypothetical protein n=1 Tax=Flavobacterium psychrophilum TaxID=96345 RepID=UPI00114FF116|nr:hypothetical protein [Flavobacterium psychrophilum]
MFEKELFSYITISVDYFDKSNNTWKVEYIQGILKSVDFENQTIDIEQHFPYINLLSKLETQTIMRTFKNREFFMIECGSLKASK